ncbi:methylated-DNA--[protein]-cysteine S-methyltransferase [Chloroflexota bacterium]
MLGFDNLYFSEYSCPLGDYIVVSSGIGVVLNQPVALAGKYLVAWQAQNVYLKDGGENNREAIQQLGEYFAGKRRVFSLPLDLSGTDFQKQVWRRLQDIPYGEMATYGSIARSLGKPRAARPLGGACMANPVAVIVPCHRVIGSNRELVGYRGGLARKRGLLALEKHWGDC